MHWVHRFPRSISAHSIFVVSSHKRSPTSWFAIATMRRNFVTNFHGVSCPPLSLGGTMSTMLFLKSGLTPCRHRIEIHHIWADPPVATIDINLFLCGNMTVVFACKPIHLKDDFFRATQLDHRFSEELVADESIVNVVIFLLSTPSLKLICRVVFFATRFLPVPVTVWPALPYVKVRVGKQIQHGRDVLLVFCCIIFHKVSTSAVNNASIPIRKACFALWFRLHVDYLA